MKVFLDGHLASANLNITCMKPKEFISPSLPPSLLGLVQMVHCDYVQSPPSTSQQVPWEEAVG